MSLMMYKIHSGLQVWRAPTHEARFAKLLALIHGDTPIS